MSRRRNCHDNPVTESFFNLLKRERIKRRTYRTREDTELAPVSTGHLGIAMEA